MNIQVHGDNIGVTPALHEYVDRKIGRLEKYFNAPAERDISVMMAVEREHHKIEVMLHVHGVLFRAEEKSSDMYASIDMVVDKLEQQINKYKEKLNQRFRSQGLRTRIRHSVENNAFTFALSEQSSEPVVTRVKRFAMKPMVVEEATLQMELLNHDFFVFMNAETEEVNVVYRRKKGNYGLIEPTL